MDIELTNEKEMPLLSRKKYTFFTTFKGATPTRKQIGEAFATKIKSDPELTVISHIYTKYGVEKARVIANVYVKKDDMMRFEDKKTLAKHIGKKDEKATAADAAPAK